MNHINNNSCNHLNNSSGGNSSSSSSNSSNSSSNNSSSSGSNNNSNNDSDQQHEIIFWKVFKNIYIRDIILSSIHNNNKSKCHNSYNSTTSLQSMLKNNKYNMVIDKLKSNHFIHFTSLPHLYNNNNYKIPYNKSKEIHQLLFNKYKDHFKRINSYDRINKHSQYYFLEHYKLIYNQNQNHYNHYRAHSLLYQVITYDSYKNYNSNKNSELIAYLKQIIDNSNSNNNNDNDKEYNINKKQKTINNNNSSSSSNNNNSNNNNNNDYIQKLKSTSSSSSSPSSESIENEIKEAIYNNKPIPINLNHLYPSRTSINYYYNIKTELNKDIKSFLINSKGILKLYDCVDNQEILELVLLKLLYHHDTQVKVCTQKSDPYYPNAPVNSLIHAKIYCLNQINKRLISNSKSSQLSSSYLQFKQHLIDNQVNTLDELISAARDMFINKDTGIKNKMNEYFGLYYNYFKSTKSRVDKCSKITMSMVLIQSIINQSHEAINKLSRNDLMEFRRKEYTFNYNNNSIGSGFGCSGDNQDESIKERSTTYFNLLIKSIDRNISRYGYDIKLDIWIKVFEIMIYNYNANLFEWILESNKTLKYIYFKFFKQEEYFLKLLSAYTRINKESNQLNYEMFNIFLNHIQDKYIYIDVGYIKYSLDKKANSHKVYSSILNHLISLPPSTIYYDIGDFAICILSSGFNDIVMVDEYIQIYNQINQHPSLNQFITTLNQEVPDPFILSAATRPTTMLISVLTESIIRLDFKLINKIISAVLNNSNSSSSSSNNNNNNIININIPTTIDNSLDLIKYLFKHQYLNQFSIICLAIQFSEYGIDKKLIIEFVQTYGNNYQRDVDALNEYEEEEQKEQVDDQFSLFNLEQFKYELDNTNNKKVKKDRILSNKIVDYYKNGYYDSVYKFLNNNNQLNITLSRSTLTDLALHPISIEWFTKLYPILFKKSIESSSSSFKDCNILIGHNPQIFEFMWDNHFNNDQERIKYIFELLDYESYLNTADHQLTEYILKSKREFIISSTRYSKLTTDQIDQLHYNSLLYGNLSIHQQIKSIFPPYQLKIDFTIIEQLTSYHNRYDVIEYLYENNLIPNLDQIIGTHNLQIIEYNQYSLKKKRKDYGGRGILVSKSMFILIHTIIKLQRQQQPTTNN